MTESRDSCYPLHPQLLAQASTRACPMCGCPGKSTTPGRAQKLPGSIQPPVMGCSPLCKAALFQLSRVLNPIWGLQSKPRTASRRKHEPKLPPFTGNVLKGKEAAESAPKRAHLLPRCKAPWGLWFLLLWFRKMSAVSAWYYSVFPPHSPQSREGSFIQQVIQQA